MAEIVRRVWWNLRFFWCACLQLDFESDRVQALVDEDLRARGLRV